MPLSNAVIELKDQFKRSRLSGLFLGIFFAVVSFAVVSFAVLSFAVLSKTVLCKTVLSKTVFSKTVILRVNARVLNSVFRSVFNKFTKTGFAVVIATLLFISISLGVIKLFYAPQAVAIVEFDNNQCYIEEQFELKWIHSVEKQSWIESYKIQNHQLLLTDTYLETFGAGTPSTESIGENNLNYPGYVHYDVNIELPYLNWMISQNIEAQIMTNNKTLSIYKLVDDYTNIYIHPSTYNIWTLMRQESCDEYA